MICCYVDEYEGDAVLKRLIDNGEEVIVKIVFDLVKEGDDFVLIVYCNFLRYLGIVCVNIGLILNLLIIVIGGGVLAVGEFFL